MRPALLIIDMLEDFVYGELGDEKFQKIIPPLDRLIKEARKSGIPVMYCNDSHEEDDPEMGIWGKHAMKGSEGAKVIEELKPEKSDEVVEKSTYGAFEGTDLEERLKKSYNGKGADTVIITGLHTHLCDRHTAYGAFARGYDVVFAEDATEAFSKEQHEEGLDYAQKFYGAKILSSNKIISEIFEKVEN